MKKILLTGGYGFIGKHLLKKLLKKYYVINIDNLTYASKFENIKNKNYKFFKVDINNRNKISEIIKKNNPDIIVNCAAETHVDNSILDPKKFIKTNINGTINLLEALRSLKKNNSKFIQISTDEVFGSLNLKDKKFDNNSKINPKSPYSSSKASADLFVQAYSNTYGINYSITHSSNNFGPGQNKEKFIPTIIKSCISKKPIPIYGNGKNIRDWIYVEDNVDAIIKVIDNGKKNSKYLIGSNNEISNNQIAKIICKSFNRISKNNFNYSSLISYVEDRKGHDFRYGVNNSSIMDLGWRSKFSFLKGIDNTIKYYLKK
tara:strand:- start:271 stop:1221 length:951 start_codon:yes stop_codon:yes gene_type:complete